MKIKNRNIHFVKNDRGGGTVYVESHNHDSLGTSVATVPYGREGVARRVNGCLTGCRNRREKIERLKEVLK